MKVIEPESHKLEEGHFNLHIDALLKAYRQGDFTPRNFLLQLHNSITCDMKGEIHPVWIYFLSQDELEVYIDKLESLPKTLPLYGIPFAIKDNIDLAGVPTTAGCAEFAYTPNQSATVVQRLLDAGAIPFGKTNLDQFATGLVGVRSPYGICQNALNPKYISGGSSSGSAIAVAKGWVSFALGTDTAGSGRVPAALNNLVGLKPTRGLFSNFGLVPACRSLDCISVFSRNVNDANTLFDVACAYDPQDSYSRKNPFLNGPRFGGVQSPPWTAGIPQAHQLNFFGDDEAQRHFEATINQLKSSGVKIVEVDFQPFLHAAKLLYEGPWVAERYLAAQTLLESQPDAIHPITRKIISAGEHATAANAFAAQYQLQTCAQGADDILSRVDCMITPTIGKAYTIAEVLAEPIQLNSNLGYYTNFMNLLDCAAIAIPTGVYANGVGLGITLFHRAFTDKSLIGFAQFIENQLNPDHQRPTSPQLAAPTTVDIVVCGAHMDGLALNWQLRERGGRFVRASKTTPNYHFIALSGGPPKRPGLIRTDKNGSAIDIEIWRLPIAELGSFVMQIPAPLGLGKVQVEGGEWLTGFICEAIGAAGAKDISSLGGWRQYLAATEPLS